MRSSKARHWNQAILKRNISGWLILLPGLILFAFFVWEPLLESVRLSLYTAQGVRLQEFVGLQNYLDVFKHPDFAPAVVNTFKYTLWSLVIGFLVPVVMAALITETVHMKGTFRLGVYFPNIMPGLAMVLMWGYFFTPGKTGVLNILLSQIGIDPQVWLTNPKMTIPLIIMILTWKSAGATALIYMASMGSISPDLYEAAAIDGARLWARFRHITVPGIMGIAKMLLILQIIAVFQILYEPLVLTNGGPNNASISIMQVVYRYAFQNFDYPMAAAVSVMICAVLVLLTVLYFRVTRERDA
jgi:multiple sugar transport system permease protein